MDALVNPVIEIITQHKLYLTLKIREVSDFFYLSKTFCLNFRFAPTSALTTKVHLMLIFNPEFILPSAIFSFFEMEKNMASYQIKYWILRDLQHEVESCWL